MATIVVKPLPSTSALVSGWPAPRQPAAGDDDALIEEAVRFHDFTSPQIIKGANFPPLAPGDLARGIPDLRWQLHDAALGHLTQLMGSVDKELNAGQIHRILLETLPEATAKRRKSVPGADRARAAARALLSDDWRSPERDRLLSQHKKGVLLRHFEQLDSAAAALHALISRAAVERALTESFGAAIVSPWGGTRAIGRPGRADSGAPLGGYVDIGENAVGLTEKLYEQFSTQAFKDAHSVKTLKLREIPATIPGGPPFRLHLRLREQEEVIYREVLPVTWKDGKDIPKPFGAWHKNLELLEAMFLHACLLPKLATTAIELGFPWALALTGGLRAYLTELVARVTTMALPIQLGYADTSGYLGVALWEALAGTDAPHATRLGYLVSRQLGQTEVTPPVAPAQPESKRQPEDGGTPGDAPDAGTPSSDASTGGPDAGTAAATQPAQPTPDALLVALQGWRQADAFINGWSANLPQHQAVTPLLRAMLSEPCLISRPDRKDKSKQTVTATLPATIADWPRFPVCRFPGVRTSEPGLDLYCGAYLTAQCHLFIADQILRVAIDDLGLPHTWSDKRTDEGDAVQLQASSSKKSGGTFTPAIAIIAGSYLWAGSHPPHITHRDGGTFDLRFGPDTVAWLPTEDSRAIDKGMLDLSLPTKKQPYSDLEGICLSRAQQDAKQPIASVFRSLMTNAVREELRRVYEPLGHAPTKAELAIYADAEKRLSGTPHFSATGSSQQIHAGYVALLLSAPTQVIFSSPIAHLRAMRGVRFGLAETDESVVAKAGEALRGAFFVFKPTDHWHHWHAQYSVKGGSGADPTPALDRWRNFLPLWTALGIDLGPFVDYLENLPLSTIDDAQIARVRKEREELLKELKSYSPSTEGRERLRTLFLRFSKSDPDGLLKPANTTSLSPTLRALVNEGEGALAKLVLKKLIEKARRFIEAIGPEDLASGGGDPTSQRRE
jgi:hypothetical protein